MVQSWSKEREREGGGDLSGIFATDDLLFYWVGVTSAGTVTE